MTADFLKFIVGALLSIFAASCPAYGGPVRAPQSTTAPQSTHFTTWKFHEDFSKGLPGWISFPLSQDVGYDPSIYTSQRGDGSVLVRDVIAEGEHQLRLGMLRPLCFHATTASIFRLKYSLEAAGRVVKASFRVASAGKQYTAALPSATGHQELEIDGRALEFQGGGDES